MKRRSLGNLLKVMDPIDRHLFFTSTWIQIGNGKSTPVWEARWLRGSAPRDLAPHMYDIARYKGRSVATEMNNNNWIRNLQHVNTIVELE
jgi:hypothetical protein